MNRRSLFGILGVGTVGAVAGACVYSPSRHHAPWMHTKWEDLPPEEKAAFTAWLRGSWDDAHRELDNTREFF